MDDLGSTLRSWRDRLSAADAGLPVTGRRRAPGLRREELAALAGISVDYLTRLEQGRASAPSGQVLESLSRALRLSAEEHRHLFTLGRRVPRSNRMRTELTPSVVRLLQQLQTPMCVYDATWTPLAWNRSFAVLFGDPGRRHGVERNLVWRYLTGAPTRARGSGDDRLRAYVADLRAVAARFPRDPRVHRLIAELRATGDRFGELWERNEVEVLHESHKTVEHPDLGVLELDCDILTVDGADLRIMILTATAGTAGADSLALLASLPVEHPTQQPVGTATSDGCRSDQESRGVRNRC
ncbi:MAG: helix-turn-helix domain-containing protein [Marmoricola sp.]